MTKVKNQPNLTPFSVKPRSVHLKIVMPQFADVIDENGNISIPSSEEGDWTVMDNVTEGGVPIISIVGNQNILKRRDKTCKIMYSQIGRLTGRRIYAHPVYGASEDCPEAFYEGAFIDWSEDNREEFASQIMPMLTKAVATDTWTNMWFGDPMRNADIRGRWSWNKYDGIFSHYARYIQEGVIKSDQTFSLPSGDISPTQAYNILKQAYDSQEELMFNWEDGDKCFYVNKKLANAYQDYLRANGDKAEYDLMRNVPIMYYNGIQVKPKAWDSTLRALNGGNTAHALILTMRGNFVYAANSSYGGGPRRNEAVRVWYSMESDTWKRQIHLMSGTELATPEFSVVAITNIA